jgi:hypothetical protein
LEYCDSSIVRNRENYYIKRFNPEYNNLNNAGSGYKHTEENEGSKGRRLYRHSNITKAKISESAFARKEKKLINKKGKDLKLPRKISEKLQLFPKLQAHITSIILANSDKVEITNIDTKVVICYDSVRKAAEALNCSPNTIRKYSAEKKYQIIIVPCTKK